MATISNTPRPGYVWDATDNCWYPIGTGPHSHADYITSGSAINPNIVDAKGDIIAATAADTVARLAVGSNDQVLTADSSTATGLKWATPSSGGMTLISTTTLSGASVVISSIPGIYNNLYYVIKNYKPANDGGLLRMRWNGDTNTRYRGLGGFSVTGTFSGDYLVLSDATDNTTAEGLIVGEIYDYTNTTTWKTGFYIGGNNDSTTATSLGASCGFHFYNQTAAITSITLYPHSGNFTSGTVLLYGVK